MAKCEVDIQEQMIYVWTEWRERDTIKMVPGTKWNPTKQVWTVKLSWAACKALRGVFADQLEVGPYLAKWATDEIAHRIKPALDIRNLVEPPLQHPYLSHLLDAEKKISAVATSFKPFPHQRTGALFLATAKQALLADEMGSGKSATAILAMRVLFESGEDMFPILIVCPNSVKRSWQNELKTWWPAASVAIVQGSAAARKKILNEQHHVYIMNWESIRLHSRLAPYGSVNLKKCIKHGGNDPKVSDATCEVHHGELNSIAFRTVIGDEIHRMKSPTAKQTRAVWHVGHQDSVKFRFGLTGTPIANDPGDIWSIMHFLSPDEYPTRTKFVDRYALLAWTPFGGINIIGVRPETKDEFFSILDPRFRRMPKDLVLPFLPPKISIRRWADMSPKQAKAYNEMAAGMVAKLESGIMLTTNPLTQMMRLTQFSSSYAEVESHLDLESGMTIIDAVKLVEPSNKVDALMDLIDDMPSDEPLVIMAASRQLIMLANARLHAAGHATRLIVGGISGDERQAGLEDFQAGRVRFILCTIAAGGEGLTLTKAMNIVFLQRDWSMVKNLQATDRVHRIGSQVHDHINVIDLVAPGTVEERQLLMLKEKETRLQEITRDRETLQKAYDVETNAPAKVQLGLKLADLDRVAKEVNADVNLNDPATIRWLLEGR